MLFIKSYVTTLAVKVTLNFLQLHVRIWWTLTGNFGNMLPLDFSKTQTRQMQLPALNLQPRKHCKKVSALSHLRCNRASNGVFLRADTPVAVKRAVEQSRSCSGNEGSDPGVDVSEDEELRGALDMHQLICQHGPLSDSPPQTADQVIEEIDQMLQVYKREVCPKIFQKGGRGGVGTQKNQKLIASLLQAICCFTCKF
ncbi:unnamed protein product [Toxocara canis]|uniref:G protein gamma domain-containing protein n=1 Tax=Toxocara canis TaxID=6265 RepID=A0A183VGD4_TOXCA|nr:unnamed protein product [Toxocara canis]